MTTDFVPMNKITHKAQLLAKVKEIVIPVHNCVPLTLMAKLFIDNKYFQRLKNIKQLGVCNFIYPGANHSRFEHSIGTYYLCDRLINRIQGFEKKEKIHKWLSQIPVLQYHYSDTSNKNIILNGTGNVEYNNYGLDNWVGELVKIAGLCHDIGHGAYSHVFDDQFIKNTSNKNHPNAHHEQRSCEIISKIVKNCSILSEHMSDDDIKFIQSLINPSDNDTGFIYEIVSNSRNSLDVDKYDYILRDSYHTSIATGFQMNRLVDSIIIIDNKIAYPEQAVNDVHTLFQSRYKMFKTVYCHKGVISAQFIISELITILDKYFNIANMIIDMDVFINLTDDYIICLMHMFLMSCDSSEKPSINGVPIDPNDTIKVKEISTRIKTHKLFSHVGTITSKTYMYLDPHFNDNDHYIYKNKIGFVSGNKKNPLDEIYVYQTKELLVNNNEINCTKISKNDISQLSPESYQEHLVIIFSKSDDKQKIYNDRKVFHNMKKKIIEQSQ
jgi:HD superfamily phosphohydrolase